MDYFSGAGKVWFVGPWCGGTWLQQIDGAYHHSVLELTDCEAAGR